MSIDFAARVAAGAALLDEKRPGWEDEISLPDLDVSSHVWCVLGQVYGDYEGGLGELGIDYNDDDTQADRGFTLRAPEFEELRAWLSIPCYSGTYIYGALTDEWKKLIRARLSAS